MSLCTKNLRIQNEPVPLPVLRQEVDLPYSPIPRVKHAQMCPSLGYRNSLRSFKNQSILAKPWPTDLDSALPNVLGTHPQHWSAASMAAKEAKYVEQTNTHILTWPCDLITPDVTFSSIGWMFTFVYLGHLFQPHLLTELLYIFWSTCGSNYLSKHKSFVLSLMLSI
jgi:hypothetical protein